MTSATVSPAGSESIRSTSAEPPEDAHLAAVRGLYAAFGQGDVPAILARLADDVSWDADWADNTAQRSTVPHFLPRRGHGEVAEFFGVLAQYTVHDFQVQALMAGDGCVVAQILIDATMPDGGRYRDEELQLWTFGPDGSITAVRHYIDTAKHLAAARGEDTTG